VDTIAHGVGHRYERGTPDRPEAQAVFLTGAELADLVPEEPAWIARPLAVAGSITQLDGEAKRAGKTSLVLALCKAVSFGEQFLGAPTAKSPVVYLTEQPMAEFSGQIEEAKLGRNPDLHIMFWDQNIGLSWPEAVQAAVVRCEEHNAKLLVVDTLGAFAGLAGESENQAGAAREVMFSLAPAQKAGLAVLIVRHSRKSGGEIGKSAMGSTAFGGAAGILANLRREPGLYETQRVLEILGRFSTANGKLVINRNEDSTYALVGDLGEAKQNHAQTSLMDVIPVTDSPSEDGISAIEARERLLDAGVERSQSWVKDHLQALFTEGRIAREQADGKGLTYLYYVPVASQPGEFPEDELASCQVA
jgi:hypothetical protein